MSSAVSPDQTLSGPRHLSPDRTTSRFGSPVAVAAFVVAVVPFVVHTWATLNGYFGQDDFIFIHRSAHSAPYDLGFLFQDYGGHLQPGTFLLSWVVTAIAPLNHTVAVVPLLAARAVTLWLCWRVLTRLFGTRWALLPFFAIFAACPLILFPTLWWAYALALFPLLLAMFGALHAHLRYLDTNRPWHAVVAGLWTVVGLAFYEKAALIPALLLGVTVLLAPRGEVAPIVWALRTHRWVWAANAALLACYVAVFVQTTTSQVSENPVTTGTLVEFTGRSIVDTLLPGLFGGPFTGSGGGASWATPHPAVRMLAVLAAAAVIAASVVRSRRRAVLPWLLLAGYLAVDLALVASTRLGLVGAAVATDPRYLGDVVPVAVLCAAFALLGGDAPKKPDNPLVQTALAAAVVAASTASFLHVAPALQFREARDYVATTRAALADRPGLVLFDAPVPGDIMIDWFVGDAFTSRVVGLIPEHPRFDRPAEELYQLDATGTPQPIVGLTDTVSAQAGPVPDCGYLVRNDIVHIPLTGTVNGRRIVRIGYYTADSAPGTVKAGDSQFPVRFTGGLHSVYVVVTGSFTEIQVSRDIDVAPMCVTDVQVGLPSQNGS